MAIRRRIFTLVPALVLTVAVSTPEIEVMLGSPASTAEAVTSSKKTHVRKTTARTKTSLKRRHARSSSIRRTVHRTHRGRRYNRHRRVRVAMYGSRAAYVMDAQTGEVLFEKNAGMPQPVASLTKLMTAIVFLETDPDLDRDVTISREDVMGSGKTQLRPGEIATVHQLLYHSLMSSDNAATKALVRASDLPSDEFLARMNRKAEVMGLHSTRFVEFTGLDPANRASASDIAQLLKFAAQRPLIAEITSTPEYTYQSNRRIHHLLNTNRIARYHQLDVFGGKTGFIQSAGYCLATWVKQGSRDLIAVVLGAPSNPARFAEARRILAKASAPSTVTVQPMLPTGT